MATVPAQRSRLIEASSIEAQVENQHERGEARDKAERVSHARSLRGALLKSNHVTRHDVYLSSLRGEIVESLNHGAGNGGRCLVSCAIGESQKSAIKIRDQAAPPIEERSRGRRFERSPRSSTDHSQRGRHFFPFDLSPSIFLRSSTNHSIGSSLRFIGQFDSESFVYLYIHIYIHIYVVSLKSYSTYTNCLIYLLHEYNLDTRTCTTIEQFLMVLIVISTGIITCWSIAVLNFRLSERSISAEAPRDRG